MGEGAFLLLGFEVVHANGRSDSRPGPERPRLSCSPSGASVIEMHARLAHQPKKDGRHVELTELTLSRREARAAQLDWPSQPIHEVMRISRCSKPLSLRMICYMAIADQYILSLKDYVIRTM